MRDVFRIGLACVSTMLLLTGCSPADDEASSADSGGGSSDTTLGSGANPGAPAADGQPDAPAAPTEMPFASGTTQAADPNSSGLPTTGEDGQALDTIAALERAVEYYQRVLRTRVAESEEEEKYFKPVPALTDLQQLVQYRVIRSVPAGPNGQRYVYDVEAGKVKLASP
jgi:hypothetical protein